MVLLVRLEMLLQVAQTRAQQGNLYFWRPGVGFVALICVENLLPCFNRQCHSKGNTPCLLLISFDTYTEYHKARGGRGRGLASVLNHTLRLRRHLENLEAEDLIRTLESDGVFARFEAFVDFD